MSGVIERKVSKDDKTISRAFGNKCMHQNIVV